MALLDDDDDLNKAIASFQAGKLSDAERCFKEVLQHQPKNVAALNLLSVVLSHQKRYIEAESYIKRRLKSIRAQTRLFIIMG